MQIGYLRIVADQRWLQSDAIPGQTWPGAARNADHALIHRIPFGINATRRLSVTSAISSLSRSPVSWGWRPQVRIDLREGIHRGGLQESADSVRPRSLGICEVSYDSGGDVCFDDVPVAV